ncbi:hypothetical protein [Brevibacillus marinus]|uniref:hypothetical protein n=1 Tax=Brevibacillus marinus TaxID=2496837 RepID=UPI000F83EC21|nr:hypothetical protein [Brevibacillus marinus]
MSKIISNSSPIVGLSILGKLSLLKELFDEVFIPEAVYQEIGFGNTNAEYGKKRIAGSRRTWGFHLISRAKCRTGAKIIREVARSRTRGDNRGKGTGPTICANG